MLPHAHKLTSSADFRRVMRRGDSSTRAGSRTMVVHLAARTDIAITGGPRFGLVVSKAVGNAVIRHRTSRRLRTVVIAYAGHLERHWDVVVRALPPASTATSADLARDFAHALESAKKKFEKE